ncbi:MAG: hypothetical protein ACRDG4_07170, partial [Chloroflexota bacterium]
LLLLRAAGGYQPTNPFSSATPLPVTILTGTAFVSMIIFVATLLPITSKGHPSDGAQLCLLVRGGEVAKRHVAVSVLSSLIFTGTRYRDLPLDQLETALSAPDGTRDSLRAHLLAYYWALDRGDIEWALDLLTKASSLCADTERTTRATITLELAYMLSRHFPRPDYARKLWNAAARDLCPPALRLRTAAAINLLEGHIAATVEQAERALKQLGPLSWRGQATPPLRVRWA